MGRPVCTMYWLRNKYRFLLSLACVLWLTTTSTKAQWVPISDPGLSGDMCSELSLAMNASCDSIDTLAAATNYGTPKHNFSAGHDNIYDATSLKYFAGLDTIRLSNNNLTDAGLPPFGSWPDILWFNANTNSLATVPRITDAPILRFLYLKYNDITSFDTSWNTPHSDIQVIDLQENELYDLPPLELYPEIRRLNVVNNHMSFSDLVPIKTNPRWLTSTWQFFPQKPFEIGGDVVKNIGESWTITVPDDSPTNTYYFYKDSVLLDSNMTGIYNLDNLQKTDEGMYYVEVTNTEFPESEAVLSSKVIKLLIADPVDEKDVQVFSPNGDGIADFILLEGEGSFEILNKGGQKVKSGSLPYSWYGDDLSGQNVEPGLYFVKNEGGYIKILVTY